MPKRSSIRAIEHSCRIHGGSLRHSDNLRVLCAQLQLSTVSRERHAFRSTGLLGLHAALVSAASNTLKALISRHHQLQRSPSLSSNLRHCNILNFSSCILGKSEAESFSGDHATKEPEGLWGGSVCAQAHFSSYATCVVNTNYDRTLQALQARPYEA